MKVVSCRGAAPVLASITKMFASSARSGSGLRSATKAIRVPSGDQDGLLSLAGPVVSCSAFPAATSKSQMWEGMRLR